MAEGKITIKGDIYGNYILQYYSSPGKNYIIQNLTLDATGTIQSNFFTPNVIGPMYFNVTNTKSPSQTWIQKYILYKTPVVTITQLADAYVGERVNLSINSDLFYNLYFNNKMIIDQLIYINKTIISLPVDTKGINILKLVLPSNYLTFNQVIQEIFVYEKIELVQNLPAKINENTNITVNVQLVNGLQVPIGNLGVQFMYLGTVLWTKQLDNQGKKQVTISIKDSLDKYKLRIVGNKDLYVKQEDFSVNTTLIRSLSVTSDIAVKQFMDMTATTVSFIVLFKNTGEPAPLVNMTVEIDGNNEKDIRHYMTDNKGSILVNLAKPQGTYIVTVLVNNSNYIMSKTIYPIEVKGFDAVNNPYILPTILISMVVGVIVLIKKKGIK